MENLSELLSSWYESSHRRNASRTSLPLKILFLGMGKTNVAIYNELKDGGHELFYLDDTDKNLDIKRYTEKELNEELPLFSLIFRSPGVPKNSTLYQLALLLTPKMTNDLLFLNLCKRPSQIIGVTGSNGKTTMVRLLEAFFKKAGYEVIVAGNIGIPLTSIIHEISDKTILILELSSYCLEDADELELDYLLYSSMAPNHLDHYYSKTEYYAAKKRCSLGAHHIYANSESLRLLNLYNNVEEANYKGPYLIYNSKNLIHESELLLEGKHNLEHLQLILKLLENFNIKEEDCYQVISTFKPLKYRQERLGYLRNLEVINDSKATSFEATLGSLQTFTKKRRILLLGGKLKSEGTLNLRPDDRVIIMGSKSYELKKRFKEATFVSSFEKLGAALEKETEASYLLFSPSGSSEDFSNFEERGRAFERWFYEQSKK